MRASGPVFIVDDDRDIRETLAEVLEEKGFEVITAKNGSEALKILRGMATSPSVILLDLMMPVMDGYKFLEERREDPRIASIPVAIITAGHGVDPTRLGNGAPIIPKPIDMPQLVGFLQGLVGAAGASS